MPVVGGAATPPFFPPPAAAGGGKPQDWVFGFEPVISPESAPGPRISFVVAEAFQDQVSGSITIFL